MSPIGRVFIVLNLILAGTFVGFSGTYLQKQFHWKTQAESTQAELTKVRSEMSSENERLRGELSVMTTSKSRIEQDLSSTKDQLAKANDEVKRLSDETSSQSASLKQLAQEIGGIKTNADAAFSKATKAFEDSVAAMKDKDEAIRTKDATVAENRDLKNQIASLNETITNKDLSIAGLTADKGQLTLLVDVAKAKGFLEGMAIPKLAGTVANVSGNLCTVSVTDNPDNAEIKPGYKFAIYDASGYKGEARVTAVDAERKAAFCTIDLKAGNVLPGDSASTHLAGY